MFQDPLNTGADPMMMRLRNILNGGNPPPEEMMGGIENMPPDLMRGVEDQSTKNGNSALDEFMAAIKGMPTRQKPGKLDRLGAIIAAFSSHPQENIEHALYGKYDRQLSDWKTKLAPLGQAANLERLGDSQQTREAYNQWREQASQRDFDERRRQFDEREGRLTERETRIAENDRSKRDLDERKFKLAEALAKYRMDPNYQIRVAEDGEYVAFNPKNPTETPKKLGVKSGEMSDAEKLGFGLSNALRLVEARADAAADADARRHENRLEEQANAASLRTTDDSPTQQKQDKINRARTLRNVKPEWKDFISDENAEVADLGTGSNWFTGKKGLDEATRKQIVDYIENGTEIPNVVSTKAKSTPTPKPAPTNTAPKVGDIKTFPNGNKGKWDGNGWVLVK